MSRQQQHRTPLKLTDNVVEVKSKVSGGVMSFSDGYLNGYERRQRLFSADNTDVTFRCRSEKIRDVSL